MRLRTNQHDYRTLAAGLNAGEAYQYDLSSISLNADGGEYVTDVRLEFGTVPAGFGPYSPVILYGYVIPGLPTGYKCIIRTEAGGKYAGNWKTASGLWTTRIAG